MRNVAVISTILLLLVLGSGLSDWLRTAKEFSVECGSSATEVTASGVIAFDSVWCDNNSNTSVYLGSTSIDGTGICISKDTANCPARDISANFGKGAMYCATAVDAGFTDAGVDAGMITNDAGFVTIDCLSGN